MSGSTPLPSDAKARLLAQMGRTRSPTRQAARATAWTVLPSGLLVALALYFAFDGPEHGKGRPLWFYLASAVSWAAVATLATIGVLGRQPRSSWRSRGALLAVAIGTPALLFALMFGMAFVFPDVAAIHPERLGLKCFGLTVAAAAFPLVALMRVRRGSDPVHPAMTGAALGAACGASAGVMVEMWCPVAAPLHVLVGHIIPIVLLTVLGAVSGARVIAMKARAPRGSAL